MRDPKSEDMETSFTKHLIQYTPEHPLFRLIKAHISYDFMDRINISGPRLIAEVYFDHASFNPAGRRDFDSLLLGGKRLDSWYPV